MIRMISEKFTALKSQRWLSRLLNRTHKALNDGNVERVLLRGRVVLAANAFIAAAYLEIVGRVLSSATEGDLQKLSPVVGHFCRGLVSKVLRATHEETLLALSKVEELDLESKDEIIQALEDAELLVERARRRAEKVGKVPAVAAT